MSSGSSLEKHRAVAGGTGCPAQWPSAVILQPSGEHDREKLPLSPLRVNGQGCSCVQCVFGSLLSCPWQDARSLHPSQGISANLFTTQSSEGRESPKEFPKIKPLKTWLGDLELTGHLPLFMATGRTVQREERKITDNTEHRQPSAPPISAV